MKDDLEQLREEFTGKGVRVMTMQALPDAPIHAIMPVHLRLVPSRHSPIPVCWAESNDGRVILGYDTLNELAMLWVATVDDFILHYAGRGGLTALCQPARGLSMAETLVKVYQIYKDRLTEGED